MSEFQSESNLSFHLEVFDGPLDLLLHLVREAKIDIKDIFISEVTEQFLAYISQTEELDDAEAAEFLSVAATLLENKSKALLPKYDEETVTDEGQLLISRLQEYQMIKEAAEKLKAKEELNKFYKAADDSTFVDKIILKDGSASALVNAFSRLLAAYNIGEETEEQEKNIVREVYTVEERHARLIDIFKREKKTSFFKLFEGAKPTKTEVVVTLIALLEMIRNGEIAARQETDGGDVEIQFIGEYNEQNG